MLMRTEQAFTASLETLDEDAVLRLTLSRERQRPLSFAEVIDLWQTDDAFCDFFSRQLAAIPFEAYFWELPPLTAESLAQPFECVVVNSPRLADVTVDYQSFAAFFTDTAAVVDFDNLGHDARLVAPCPLGEPGQYTHLARFLRQAPRTQQRLFWHRLGQLCQERIGRRPLWLSTSGLGVCWLHARLDSEPKYYTYPHYRQSRYFRQRQPA